jgi:hypothetical protein
VKGIMVLAAVIVSVLVLSSTASAGGSAITCAHGANCGSGDLGGNPPSNSSGTLPFTGVDLAGAAGLGGLLLVSGVALHRLGRRRS